MSKRDDIRQSQISVVAIELRSGLTEKTIILQYEPQVRGSCKKVSFVLGTFVAFIPCKHKK